MHADRPSEIRPVVWGARAVPIAQVARAVEVHFWGWEINVEFSAKRRREGGVGDTERKDPDAPSPPAHAQPPPTHNLREGPR